GIRAFHVTGVQTCALPIWALAALSAAALTLTGCASSAGIDPATMTIQPTQLGLPAADASVSVAAALDAQWWTVWKDAALSDLMADQKSIVKGKQTGSNVNC